MYELCRKSLQNSSVNKSTQREQTSLAEAAHYPPPLPPRPWIALIPNLESQRGDTDYAPPPPPKKKKINCSLHHGRAIVEIGSKCIHNLLSNGGVSDWAVSIVQIATKIQSPRTPSIKFHRNPFITFGVLLLYYSQKDKEGKTDRQRNEHTNATKSITSFAKDIIIFLSNGRISDWAVSIVS